jgi:hypothetical protein
MLRFASPPDEAFAAIVDASLGLYRDMLRTGIEDNIDAEELLAVYSPQIRELFTAKELSEQLRKLLDAHTGPSLYMPTDYHFLILYEVLENWISFHNDVVDEEGADDVGEAISLGRIDFDWIVEHYFWDEDFLMGPDERNRMTREMKEMMGFSEESFGVVNRLKPHPDELELKLAPEELSEQVENHYVAGEAYPFRGNDTP